MQCIAAYDMKALLVNLKYAAVLEVLSQQG